jgi:hypothetical protein
MMARDPECSALSDVRSSKDLDQAWGVGLDPDRRIALADVAKQRPEQQPGHLELEPPRNDTWPAY